MAQSSSENSGARLRPYLWWLATFAALLLGYADLWRGGITLGPILLILGYCVLIPLAILK